MSGSAFPSWFSIQEPEKEFTKRPHFGKAYFHVSHRRVYDKKLDTAEPTQNTILPFVGTDAITSLTALSNALPFVGTDAITNFDGACEL